MPHPRRGIVAPKLHAPLLDEPDLAPWHQGLSFERSPRAEREHCHDDNVGEKPHNDLREGNQASACDGRLWSRQSNPWSDYCKPQGPVGAGVFRHVEVQQPARTVMDSHRHIPQPERRRDRDEEVAGDDGIRRVPQKRRPAPIAALGSRSRSRLGPPHDQSIAPVAAPGQQHQRCPRRSINAPGVDAALLKERELAAQHQVLGVDSSSRSDRERDQPGQVDQQPKNDTQENKHAARMPPPANRRVTSSGRLDSSSCGAQATPGVVKIADIKIVFYRTHRALIT